MKQFDYIRDVLKNNGYYQCGRYFSKEVPTNITTTNVLGIGMNTFSCIDNVSYMSTNDFDLYCAHSHDITSIASSPIIIDEKTKIMQTILYELTHEGTMLSIPNKKTLLELNYLVEVNQKMLLSNKGITYLDDVVRIIQNK